MKAELVYEDSSDQEHYDEQLLNGLSLKAATIAGSPERLNEDSYAVAADDQAVFVAVFDGTTSLKPIAALDHISGARFASHFLKSRLAMCNPAASMHDVLIDLNSALLKENQKLGGELSDTHSLPASFATVLKIDSNGVSFAHVGDSFGIVFFKDGTSDVFTDDKNAKFDNEMFQLIMKVAKEQSLTPRKAREDEQVKEVLIQMFIRRNNNPDGSGSGLMNGDPNIDQYVQTGAFQIDNVAAILLGTDGLLPPGWLLESPQDLQKMFAAITEGGFEKLFDLKHAAEDNDPDWHFTRYKHSDDATGILIQF